MTADSWILESLGAEKLRDAAEESARRRLRGALGVERSAQVSDERLRFVANALELRVFGLLEAEDAADLREAAVEAFQVLRAIPRAPAPLDAAAAMVRLGCLGVLGDRGADVRRLLIDEGLPTLATDASDWGTRVAATILDIWLRLFRKQGWDDLDAVQQHVASLRAEQRTLEPTFLAEAEQRRDARPAWELISQYHLAKAAEILGTYLSQGSVDGHYDIREQLEAQFDRAIATAARGQLMEREALARLLARTARALVDNSIWTVTRAVNSRVTKLTPPVVPKFKVGDRVVWRALDAQVMAVHAGPSATPWLYDLATDPAPNETHTRADIERHVFSRPESALVAAERPR